MSVVLGSGGVEATPMLAVTFGKGLSLYSHRSAATALRILSAISIARSWPWPITMEAVSSPPMRYAVPS